MILSCRKGLYNQYYVYTPLHVAGQIKNKEHAEPLSKEESCSTRRAWLHVAMPLALLLGNGIIGYSKGRRWAGNTLFLV